MSSEIEALFAESDEIAPQGLSPSARDDFRGGNMEFDTEGEIRRRQKTLEKIKSQRNPARIKEAIAAYKHDLPRLLQENKGVVAYNGGQRVGDAPTLSDLIQALKRDGFKNSNGLFIKHVRPIDDDSEHFLSPTR